MVAPSIRLYKPAAEFYIDEQCYINELSNTDEDGDVSIARARVEPGVTTRWHKLDGITERYCILQGSARVEVGDEPAQDLAYGDVVIIPPMCLQRITNTGEDDLVFLAICSPRFVQDRYIDMEDSH
jgi:mannose-6-phosphate isomerase-like protein (cupin superfamily)